MTTWEDGPEHAPLARPDQFAHAAAVPLPTGVAPPRSRPAAPVERPAFDQPGAPVAALETLVPPVEETRDPEVPFDIAASSLTEETSAWGAAHWSRPTDDRLTPPASLDYGSGPWPTPAKNYSPPPAPGPATPPVVVPVSATAVASALTPGVIICLVIGGIVWPIAPVAFVLAFVLALRMRACRTLTRGLIGAGMVFLGIAGYIDIRSEGVFGSWDLMCSRAQVLCWITLVLAGIAVYRHLRAGASPARDSWE